MHIVLNVGHQHMLAVIPAHQINLKDDTTRRFLASLSQRLEALQKQQSSQFSFTVMGTRIPRMVPIGMGGVSDAMKHEALAVNIIGEVIEYAQELEHDVVQFQLVPDIVSTAESLLALCTENANAKCNVGIHRLRTREQSRLEEVVHNVKKFGVHFAETFW